MIKPKIIKNLSQLALSFLLVFSCNLLFAEEKGQLININQNFQIAFTDLGNRILRQGDIVKVTLNADEYLYMQVLESSAILSKLGSSKVEGYQTNLKNFQRMAVGNPVVKVNQAQEKMDNSRTVITETKNTDELTQSQIQKLKQDLSIAEEEVKRLQESNQASNARLNELAIQSHIEKAKVIVPPEQTNNKAVLEQLKVHVENMRKLVNEND